MSEGERILIANDDEAFLESIAGLLRRESFSCDCAGSSAEALKMLCSRHYDLLIADMKMPGHQEIEFFNALPRRVKDLPALLVTADPSSLPPMEHLDLHVLACLPKPVDFDELLGEVRRALFLPKLRRTVQCMQERLIGWREDFRLLEETLLRSPGEEEPSLMEACLGISLWNNIALLEDLRKLVASMKDLPRLKELEQVLKETADVLEKTKGLFSPEEFDAVRSRLAGPSPFDD